MKLVGGLNSTPWSRTWWGPGDLPGGSCRRDAGYCSSAEPVMREIEGLVNVPLPASLTVGHAYGLIVLSDQPLAARFALFILSEQGQTILRRHGFDASACHKPP